MAEGARVCARRAKAKPRSKHSRSSKKAKAVVVAFGPFQSPEEASSVALGLTMDVHFIRREIKRLEIARDLLQMRSVHHRRDASGSLMLKVKAYFETFRHGWGTNADNVRTPRTAFVQLDFLGSMMDEDVWIGNHLFGVKHLAQQHEIYSLFFRIIDFRLQGFEIADTEESVVIKCSCVLRFQVIPATISGVFPHILEHDSLRHRLIGRQIEAPATLTFFFNHESVVTRLEAELDMVGAFMPLLNNPLDVALLLNDALIYENCLLGLQIDDDQPTTDMKSDPAINRVCSHGMRLAHILH